MTRAIRVICATALCAGLLVGAAGPSGAGPVDSPDPGVINWAVDVEMTADDQFYWILRSDGLVLWGVTHYGDAWGQLRSGETAVSLSATPDGAGYWIFTSLGRVLTFGTAEHFGDMDGQRLNGPVVDSVATPTGRGYYMVASDGGVFAFGDATFYGSMGGRRLNGPVNGLAPTADNGGYWLVASDGGIFSFGTAQFYGSMGGQHLNQPVVGMVGQGNGYLMVAADGGIFNFGQSVFHGSLGNREVSSPITALASKRDLSGYVMVAADGEHHMFGDYGVTAPDDFSVSIGACGVGPIGVDGADPVMGCQITGTATATSWTQSYSTPQLWARSAWPDGHDGVWRSRGEIGPVEAPLDQPSAYFTETVYAGERRCWRSSNWGWGNPTPWGSVHYADEIACVEVDADGGRFIDAPPAAIWRPDEVPTTTPWFAWYNPKAPPAENAVLAHTDGSRWLFRNNQRHVISPADVDCYIAAAPRVVPVVDLGAFIMGSPAPAC